MSELTDYDKLRKKPSIFVDSVLGVKPFDYQKKLLDSPARHRTIVSGRQVGKSRMCAWLALHKAITQAYSQVLITAPSLRQSSLLFQTLQSEMDKSALTTKQWGVERDTQTIVEFDNGSSIHCLPTGRNGNKIRGFTADMVIVDEAAFIADSIFGDILQPMLFSSGGSMILASTPWGKSGFLYEKFEQAQYSDKWDRVSVSSYDNPLNDKEDLDDYKIGKTEAQVKREVYGKFIDDAGQFFPSDDISKCMPGGKPEREGDHAYLGADIAGTGDDRTVFYGVDDVGNVFLYDEVYGDMGVLEAANYIKVLDGMHNFDRIFVDRTAIGQGTIETLANDPKIDRKHEPIYFSIQKKQQIYQRLKAALESGALHLPFDSDLKSELESIGSKTTKSGNLQLHARGGENNEGRDDHVDALALACWGLPNFGDSNQSRGAKRAVSAPNNARARRRRRNSEKTTQGSRSTKSYTINNRGKRQSIRDRR